MKQEPDLLLEKYLEGILQLGMIILFANTLAIASLFSIFTNLLEMKIKLN
jgi:hypothetical protein